MGGAVSGAVEVEKPEPVPGRGARRLVLLREEKVDKLEVAELTGRLRQPASASASASAAAAAAAAASASAGGGVESADAVDGSAGESVAAVARKVVAREKVVAVLR